MDYQRRGACSHIMAASDPHLRCPGCRDCFLPGNPCSVCESLSAEQVALAIQARSLRLRRQARRAGSADSSSQCGPLEDKTGPPGSTPGLPVSKQGEGLTSPRSVRSRDGGRGSPSAESLSSLAGDLMSSEEEGSRDWRPQHGDHDSLPEVLPCDRESSVATSRPSAQESVGRDEALPSGDPDARRYKDTLQNVFSFNPNMVPQDVPVDNVFGGELMALCHETQKEDRHPSLSGSGVLGSALRHTAGVLGGVAHSPLVEAGRARESAQRWGTYMSLTSPPIRLYRPEYYRVHYSADVPEAEVLQPQQLYSTSSFLAIAKGTPPTDFRIRHSLLRDWEGLQRASLGVINHLDWFLSTVWKMVGTVEVEPQMRANIDNMLTSSSVAVNHLAHRQARLLAGNATFRRDGLLDASVLDRAGAQFLRSQPIGGADLFAGKVPDALRVASEDRNKQLLFQAAVKPAGRGAGGSP